MIEADTLREVVMTAGTGLGLWLLRRLAVSMREMVLEVQTLREFPNQMAKALRDMTDKFDARMAANERRQEILETQFRVVVDRLLQNEEEGKP